MSFSKPALCFASLLSVAGAAPFAQAALYDRGNGMIYDSAQNITWLQDANYARTSGYDATGAMLWSKANTWATSLVYDDIGGWRLPTAHLLASDSCDGMDIFSGNCNSGYNNTRSEIGHLFAELGNYAPADIDGNMTDDGYGFLHTVFTSADTGASTSFLNVQAYMYWMEDVDANDPYYRAWVFFNLDGSQQPDSQWNYYYAWAVHDGDVAAVPVPAAAWMFGSGIVALAGMARRKVGTA